MTEKDYDKVNIQLLALVRIAQRVSATLEAGNSDFYSCHAIRAIEDLATLLRTRLNLDHRVAQEGATSD